MILKYIGLLILVILAYPFFLVFACPVYLAEIAKGRGKITCGRITCGIFAFLLGLILDAIAIPCILIGTALLILASPIILSVKCYKTHKRRREIKQRAKEIIASCAQAATQDN